MENQNKTKKQSVRIQTSLLNGVEKKALVWMAGKLPPSVNSDMLTALGVVGAVMIFVGYVLSGVNINWLWLASAGFVVNWIGDSLDGTIARVRHQQRPRYGFFLDHNVDCINETLMFVGLGLSPLMKFSSALLVLAAYLILSVYVYINAHLKGEFKLTYAKLGPTEMRVIAIIANTLFIFVPAFRNWTWKFNTIGGEYAEFKILDIVALVIFVAIMVAYFVNFIRDAKILSKEDPRPEYKPEENK